MASGSTAHILQALLANSVIAGAKGVTAVLTGSGAMMAETLHSLADCGNQLLLLLGVKRSRKPPDDSHPLGYGRALYFWSFMVALLLFLGGGVYSVYEGIHKIRAPEDVSNVWLGVLILGVSLAIEGWATLGNILELNRRRGDVPFFQFLRRTKDSDLVVIFGENSAAVLGLALAMGALGLGYATGDGRWDGVGTLAIGVVLLAVAVFLAVEVKSLLVGESADPDIERAIHDLAPEHPQIVEVLRVLTVQQGPGEVVVAMKLRMKSDLKTGELCAAINAFEQALSERKPEVRWCFAEPDVEA